jgi:hypothetical protein
MVVIRTFKETIETASAIRTPSHNEYNEKYTSFQVLLSVIAILIINHIPTKKVGKKGTPLNVVPIAVNRIPYASVEYTLAICTEIDSDMSDE